MVSASWSFKTQWKPKENASHSFANIKNIKEIQDFLVSNQWKPKENASHPFANIKNIKEIQDFLVSNQWKPKDFLIFRFSNLKKLKQTNNLLQKTLEKTAKSQCVLFEFANTPMFFC